MGEDLVALAQKQLERHRRSRVWWLGSRCKECDEPWECRVARTAKMVISDRVTLADLDTVQLHPEHPNTRWPS